MGGSSKPQPAVTTQVNKTEVPAWVSAAGQENYQAASNLPGYVPYTGERVAGLSAGEAAAPGTVNAGQARANAGFDLAGGVAAGVAGFNPSQVTAPAGVANVTNGGGFLAADMTKYMDPNVQAVIDPTMAQMKRVQEQGGQAMADQARAAGVNPTGSSRFGVQSAVYNAEQERNQALTAAQLRSQAFESGAGRAMTDTQTALQAALANQQSGLTTQGQGLQAGIANQNAGIAGANVRLGAGNLATQTGTAAGTSANQAAVLGAGFGATERGIEQARLDANYGEFMRQQQAPIDAINLRSATLSATPYDKTSTGTTTATAAPAQSNPWMTAIGGAATLGSMFFSDRKVKKNVKRLGKVPGTDLNQYEFEYKKGFMGGAGMRPGKQIGLMAQDVEKKVPGAVTPVIMGGKKVKAVDYSAAMLTPKKMTGAPRDPRDDKGKLRGRYKPRVGVSAHLGF